MKIAHKILTVISAVILFTACGNNETSNTSVAANTTENIKVWGNCEMCKKTIEGSLKVKGVAKADWNVDTKIMNVSFDSTQINLDQIEKNIASVGYDNEKYSGDINAYKNLPECCQYERKK